MSNLIVLRFTLLLTVAVVASMGSKTAAQEPRVRTLPHQRVPIESRLEPGDQIVEMNYWADVVHPDYGVETREEIVARMTRQTDLIATVRIGQVTPFLVEDGSWIRTRVTGTAESVLTGPPDRKFEAQFDGGEMVIKGVRIRAESYPVLRPGSRYLIFVQSGGGTPWILDAFSLEDGKIVARPEWARAKDLPENPFSGRSVQQTIAEVKRALARRQ